MLYNNRAIRTSCQNGYLELVKYLISKGGSITSFNNECFRKACRNGHLNTVKYILNDLKINVN